MYLLTEISQFVCLDVTTVSTLCRGTKKISAQHFNGCEKISKQFDVPVTVAAQVIQKVKKPKECIQLL